MHSFRRHGYGGASVARLAQDTGVRSSSLYNAYGDKAGLYLKALEHYALSFVRPRLETYAGPEATLEDLEGFFLSLFAPPLNDGYGCLVTNAVGVLGGDSLASPWVTSVISEMGRHVEDVLGRELPPAEASVTATRLVLLYEGLLVLSRGGLLGPTHEQAVRAQFAELRTQRRGRGTPRPARSTKRRSP